MSPSTYSDTCKASARVIWKTCFAPMQWQEWDPDVQDLLDVEGSGCENGTTFVFRMNDGGKIPMVLSEVVENQSLTFSGSMMWRTVHAKGTVLLEEAKDQKTTKITYTFGVSGVLGGVVNMMNHKEIENGTHRGLKNIIRLSEAAALDESET